MGTHFETSTITETSRGRYGEVSFAKLLRAEKDQFDGIGFWKDLVSSFKPDLVFLIDKTGSMADQIESVKSELKIL